MPRRKEHARTKNMLPEKSLEHHMTAEMNNKFSIKRYLKKISWFTIGSVVVVLLLNIPIALTPPYLSGKAMIFLFMTGGALSLFIHSLFYTLPFTDSYLLSITTSFIMLILSSFLIICHSKWRRPWAAILTVLGFILWWLSPIVILSIAMT